VFGPQVGVAAGPLGAAQAADREMARLFAVRARALAAFAASRPAATDRAQGEHGAMSASRWAARPEVLRPVSEWATSEAQVALVRPEGAVQGLLERSLTLVSCLPGTLAALEGGLCHEGHVPPMLDHVAGIADELVRAEVEAELLCWIAARAAGGQLTTGPELRERAVRVVRRRNARDEAQKQLKALRERGVHRGRARVDGLAGLEVVGTTAEIEALAAALTAYADAVADEPGAPPRTRVQKMLDCLQDLVLRPGENGLAPVQARFTLVAAVETLLDGSGRPTRTPR